MVGYILLLKASPPISDLRYSLLCVTPTTFVPPFIRFFNSTLQDGWGVRLMDEKMYWLKTSRWFHKSFLKLTFWLWVIVFIMAMSNRHTKREDASMVIYRCHFHCLRSLNQLWITNFFQILPENQIRYLGGGGRQHCHAKCKALPSKC